MSLFGHVKWEQVQTPKSNVWPLRKLSRPLRLFAFPHFLDRERQIVLGPTAIHHRRLRSKLAVWNKQPDDAKEYVSL